MEIKDITMENGRTYQVKVEGENQIIVGPPEGLVDELGLPEPLATRLHNILHARGLFSYKDLARQRNAALGAIQEALMVDAQRLAEAFHQYGG